MNIGLVERIKETKDPFLLEVNYEGRKVHPFVYVVDANLKNISISYIQPEGKTSPPALSIDRNLFSNNVQVARVFKQFPLTSETLEKLKYSEKRRLFGLKDQLLRLTSATKAGIQRIAVGYFQGVEQEGNNLMYYLGLIPEKEVSFYTAPQEQGDARKLGHIRARRKKGYSLDSIRSLSGIEEKVEIILPQDLEKLV